MEIILSKQLVEFLQVISAIDIVTFFFKESIKIVAVIDNICINKEICSVIPNIHKCRDLCRTINVIEKLT